MEIKIMLLLLFKLTTCKENKKYDTNFYDKKMEDLDMDLME